MTTHGAGDVTPGPGAVLIGQHPDDGADAMLRAIDDKPDLIISDYSMQALDGKQLVQKLKGRSTTANIPVILMASKTDITEKLKVLQDTVEDSSRKPFFLKEAAARIKKVVTRFRWKRWRAKRRANPCCAAAWPR